MNSDVSWCVLTAFGSGCQKLGHPVPLSNFVFEEYSARSQPAQKYVPGRFSSSSGLGPLVAQHLIRLRREQLAPLGIAVGHARDDGGLRDGRSREDGRGEGGEDGAALHRAHNDTAAPSGCA
jgi:hypothetical protein